MLCFPKQFCCRITHATWWSATPDKSGLGSSAFARRYLRNRVFFLFLRLLRCFSSPGSLPYVMDWRMDDWSSSSRVSPFRHLRINGYLHLPAAFRSLSRLSSALSAKASTLRSFLLNLFDAQRCIFFIKELSWFVYCFLTRFPDSKCCSARYFTISRMS